jgi:sucrose-6-phosphate hydrolase SacC (GH32 family)
MKRVVLLAVSLLVAGCGKYADFSLPKLAGGDANVRFTFEELPGPVLERGDALDVLNPSVLPTREMFYSEWDGRTWHTAQAHSDDGIHWLKLFRVLSPDPHTWEGSYIAANGSALNIGNQVWYWYVAGARDRPSIGLARDWHKEPRPVLEPGPYMSWDEYGVADPYVIQIGAGYYMYFLGENRAWQQRIGVARSSDGIHWQKLRSNPILEIGDPGAFDENGLGEPAVWSAGGFYWMIYTGRGAGEVRRLGMARSTEGIHWTKLDQVFSGAHAWDAKVMCDPSVLRVVRSDVLVWFGGGDVASPDENLHGQIGYGVLRMVSK